jgi:hypothetical protein
MQDSPLLEKLDWVFTSPDWIAEFPNTLSFQLPSLGSDHSPINVKIGNDIPKDYGTIRCFSLAVRINYCKIRGASLI